MANNNTYGSVPSSRVNNYPNTTKKSIRYTQPYKKLYEVKTNQTEESGLKTTTFEYEPPVKEARMNKQVQFDEKPDLIGSTSFRMK